MGKAKHLFTISSSMACGDKPITMQINAFNASEGVARAFAWFVYLSSGLNLARRGTPYIIGSAANADNRRTTQILA